MGKAWSDEEVRATVAKYFEIDARQRAGQRVIKTHEYKRLAIRFPARTWKSFEFKMANISGVLNDLDQKYCEGLKPLGNYQRSLREAVVAHLADEPRGFYVENDDGA